VIEARGVRVEMRDGAGLATDVFRPDTVDPVAVLVSRTPYGRATASPPPATERLVDAGFAVVVQDCRGRFDSEGDWTYVRAEVDDGYDTVEWAARQPWSTGRVGMFGASYMANAQWMAAISRPPHLSAIAPECCPADYWSASFEAGGAFRLALRFSWAASMVASTAARSGFEDPGLEPLARANEAMYDAIARNDREAVAAAGASARAVLHELYRRRPLRTAGAWFGSARWLGEIFEHEDPDDAYWRRIAPSSHYDVLDLPAVHVAGWYDIHLRGTLANFAGMRRQAPTRRARAAQHLVVGPWGHWAPQERVVGEVDFGPRAVLDTVQLRIDWFGRWLQDRPAPHLPPVRIFVMGDDEWRDEEDWPPARARVESWFLRVGGTLGRDAPVGDEAADEFVYDPRTPVPTVGGRLLAMGELAGPRDQRGVSGRADVIVYASRPFAGEIEITGPVVAELWAATDAPDTDFTAVLVDVHPDGAAMNLCEGSVRARHAGLPVPLRPGAAYRYTLDLGATSAVLGAGHRLALHVSSSSYPEWEPNPNTGRPLGVDREEDLRPARQRILHDALHPSRVVLFVAPR